MSRPITFQNNKQPCLNAENLNKMQDELNQFRNLINCKYGTGLIYTHNGISYTKNSDDSFTLNGTATGGTSYLVFTDIMSLDGTYTLQLVDNNNSNIYMQGMDVDNNYQIDLSTRASNLITNTINSRYVFSIYVIEGTVLDNVKIYPQLEQGTTPTSYVPYVPDNVINIVNNVKTSLSELANKLVFTGILPANYDLLDLYNSIGLKISIIDNEVLKYVNFPSEAYGYGTLITICNTVGASWNNAQIYITDGIGVNESRGLYIRTGSGTWIMITGTFGIANTTAS